jgi:hypothetical protein
MNNTHLNFILVRVSFYLLELLGLWHSGVKRPRQLSSGAIRWIRNLSLSHGCNFIKICKLCAQATSREESWASGTDSLVQTKPENWQARVLCPSQTLDPSQKCEHHALTS